MQPKPNISGGTASQFKCSTAFLHLCSHVQDYNDVEVEHTGDRKAGGFGGVVKHKAAMAVVKKQSAIRNAKDLHAYCNGNLSRKKVSAMNDTKTP